MWFTMLCAASPIKTTFFYALDHESSSVVTISGQRWMPDGIMEMILRIRGSLLAYSVARTEV
jgi:hypothetical protein